MIKSSPMLIAFLGLPGSGKGTQAKLLQKNLGFLYFSTGDYARQEIAKNSQLGKEMTKYLDCGRLLPELMVEQVINKYLEINQRAIRQKGLILDGFPRRLSDAQNLASRIIDLHFPQLLVIYLQLSEQEAIERIIKRQHNRGDDTQKIALNRLREFRQETAPVIDFYRQRNCLWEIDGQPPIKKIHQDIVKQLQEWV